MKQTFKRWPDSLPGREREMRKPSSISANCHRTARLPHYCNRALRGENVSEGKPGRKGLIFEALTGSKSAGNADKPSVSKGRKRGLASVILLHSHCTGSQVVDYQWSG